MAIGASAPARSIFEGICNVKVLKPGDMDPNRLGKRVLGAKLQPLPLDALAARIPGLTDATTELATDAIKTLKTVDDCDPIKFLTDAATVQLPFVSPAAVAAPVVAKHKTLPSPTRANTILPNAMCLNEIFEEGTDIGSSDTSATATPRLIGRHTANFTAGRTGSGRRAKFHKSRTTSCSSSDDDDSESRKKRAHKIVVDASKPFAGVQRRDSNDDSSDSQDPNPTCGGAASTMQTVTVHMATSNGSGGGGSAGGGSSAGGSGADAAAGDSSGVTAMDQAQDHTSRQRSMHGFRRHRTSRCRNEIRLRESKSLNRITEVQDEDRLLTISTQHANRSPALSTGAIEPERSTSPSIASAQSIAQPAPACVVPKPKSFGARLLAGFKRTPSDGKAEHKSRAAGNNAAGNKVPCNGKPAHTIAAVDATNPISWIKNSKPPLRVKAQQRFKNLKCLVDIFS